MKNTVCLVKINEDVDMNMPPLGLLYVGDALTKAGYKKVEIYHLKKHEVDTYAQKIIEDKPLFVGFSVFTGNCMKSYITMSEYLKKHSNIPVVWGNAHPSLLPQQCLSEDYIDIVCIGEGEITTVELANALKDKTDLSKVRGIGYKENGKVIINAPREFMKNLDGYSANWDLVDVSRYIQPRWDLKRVLPVTTSRGCPYSCQFCYNQEFNKQRWRAHSADFAVPRLKKLKDEYKLDGLLFLDDEFFINKKRSFEIVERVGLPYYANARVEHVDKEFAARLDATQCKAIMFGIESGNNRVLKEVINKGSTVEDSINAFRMISKYEDMEMVISFIFALPGETYDEFRDSIKLIMKAIKMHRKTSISTGYYLPVPGTGLFNEAVRGGFNPPVRTQDWIIMDKWVVSEFKLSWIDWITSEECIQLRRDFIVLSLLYRNNFPLIRKIMAWRLGSGNKFLTIDMWLVRNAWKAYEWIRIRLNKFF